MKERKGEVEGERKSVCEIEGRGNSREKLHIRVACSLRPSGSPLLL